ncbi:hypothetical protein Q5752_003623 [Cryptotrichosporon argae]
MPPTVRHVASTHELRSTSMTYSPSGPSSAPLPSTSASTSTTPSPPPPTPPPKPDAADPSVAALASARQKLSSQDMEAMRRVRSMMGDLSDSGSSLASASTSPVSPAFGPGALGGHPRVLRPRRSTLSREVEPHDDGDKADFERTPRPGAPDAPGDKADYVIAVVGHDGVGKSTVVRRAIKSCGGSLPVSVTQDGYTVSSCSAVVEPGGKLQHACRVDFVEVGLRALDLAGVAAVWPAGLPPISGVILCYDATRAESLRGLSEALHFLVPHHPMVLFACKSDPDAALQVEAAVGDAIGQPYNVGLIEVTTATVQGKAKMRTGLRWLLYKLEQRQRRDKRRSRMANTLNIQHALSSTPVPGPTTDSDAGSADHVMWRPGHGMTGASRVDGANDDRRSSTSSLGWMMKSPITSESIVPPATAATSGTAETGETQEGGKADEVKDEPPQYASLEDLLNKLFTAIVSTQDPTFVRAFFMTYRRFCQPIILMKEFLARYHEVEHYAISNDVKLWALMKITGALIDWTSQYPGDLAGEPTQAVFRETLAFALRHTFMAHLTADLVAIEAGLVDVVDLDASWSLRPDGNPAAPSVTGSSAAELVLDHDVLYELDSGSSSRLDKAGSARTVEKDEPASSMRSTRTVSTTSLNAEPAEAEYLMARTDSATSDAEPRPSNGASAYERSRSNQSGVPSSGLGDDAGWHRWNYAMTLVVGSDPRHFAMELTRMQWELFADIRARDVFRHDFGREKDDPVGRSITFFNHLSRWVSTMILASPKPKHRARTYEAFVRIAHQLRRLNNYDSLYAVVSGARETSVHRLAQTHALVKLEPASARDWASHLRLMDPRGGYVHYRRALQADIAHGRAAIPLLVATLGLVNRLQVVRRADVRDDGMIHWDKFARFGDILGVLGECQARGPVVRDQVGPSFRRLIEETPVITNEDGLFERSRMLEPGGAQATGGVLRKLAGLGL